MLEELRRIPGADAWRLVSVQALHRFYTRNDQSVVASWMTREDREHAIADNIEYMNRVCRFPRTRPLTRRRLSFSDSRRARRWRRAPPFAARRPAAGLIMLGGDIPPDVRDDASLQWPPVLIGVGSARTRGTARAWNPTCSSWLRAA